MREHRNRGSLRTVRKFFPDIKEVSDANANHEVEVTARDSKIAAKKNHVECALAVACKRSEHADGMIISRSTAYVIKGRKAIRFKLPEAVTREVVSFDRGSEFAEGLYTLLAPTPSQRLGSRETRTKSSGGKPPFKSKRHKPHITTGIRTVLGSKEI